MSEDELGAASRLAFDRLFAGIPSDLTHYKESLAQGGRNFHVQRESQSILFQVAYGKWFTLKFDQGKYVTFVAAGGSSANVLIAGHPDCQEEYLQLLDWAVAAIPLANRQFLQRKTLVQDLLAELETVFQPFGLDGGISLGQAMLDDDYESEDKEKMAAAYAQDVTDNWQHVPDDVLEQYWGSFSVFPYLDAKGWKYYLPATMRRILKNPDSNCEFYTRISLLPGKTGPQQWSPSIIVENLGMTVDQGRFIGRFLTYLAELDRDWIDDHPAESGQLKLWQNAFPRSGT